jgi:hypothetical protein
MRDFWPEVENSFRRSGTHLNTRPVPIARGFFPQDAKIPEEVPIYFKGIFVGLREKITARGLGHLLENLVLRWVLASGYF